MQYPRRPTFARRRAAPKGISRWYKNGIVRHKRDQMGTRHRHKFAQRPPKLAPWHKGQRKVLDRHPNVDERCMNALHNDQEQDRNADLFHKSGSLDLGELSTLEHLATEGCERRTEPRRCAKRA